MSIYVNKNNGFEQTETIARECPHCGATAQLLPLATPSYEALMQARPTHAGLVYRCAACNEPRFVRVTVRGFSAERVELSSSFAEVERARERFQYGYLPPDAERLLREALDCYTAGCFNAFALVSRRAVELALEGLDADAPRRWRDHFKDVLRIAEIDAATASKLDSVVFGADKAVAEVGADEAAVLIEAIKDLFYQAYVREAKLKSAIRMRRYFASESRKVTPIDRGRRERA